MSPITHLLVSWLVAEATVEGRRARVLVTVAGVVPDVDGLGLLVDLAKSGNADNPEYWSEFHHVLGHNLWLCVLTVGICAAIAKSHRLKCAIASAVTFHIHLLMDLVGSRGPDGYNWPISYLAPVSTRPEFSWQGQWALNAWPNFVITTAALAAILYLSWRRGHSPLELISSSADQAFVVTLRSRFVPK